MGPVPLPPQRLAMISLHRYISRPLRTIRSILPLVLVVAAGGCADFYERQADRQVQALVKDRENKTLNYRPQVEAPVDHQAVLPHKDAYVKIPQSAVVHDGQPQAEALKVE